MKSIKIEDDLFEELLAAVVEEGINFTQAIRNLKNNSPSNSNTGEKDNQLLNNNFLMNHINSSKFQAKRKPTSRFLEILHFIHEEKGDEFAKVLDISGRSRKYFGRSKKELEESGKSVQPRRIPQSEYWVTTNNNTGQKKKRLENVMRMLGYDSQIIEKACKKIES